MIGEGDAAPEFTLPAVVDGDVEEVGLDDYLGEDIVVLAFYPADFNPACDGETTDLDELDLFTMQKDVSILGISADSVYSHRAFAEKYDLHIPLLADVHGAAAANYGVVADAGTGHLVNRAVVVIDPGGEVQYTWQTEDLQRLPPVEQVREAVEAVGGSSTAEARYRVGHAHYVEGRRAFTKAMGAFEEMEWMMAQGDFTRAQEEFEEAADQFNTAVRFGEDETSLAHFEHAEEKAEALWQAAEWLAESASAYASGEGATGEQMRSDAEAPLEEARDIHEPPDPDDFPPEEAPADFGDEEGEGSILPTEDDGPAASLEEDLTPDTPEAEALAEEMGDEPADEATAVGGDGADPAVGGDADADAEAAGADDEIDDEIDDEELEEIAAELEEQTKQVQAKQESDLDPEAEDVAPDDAADIAEDGESDAGADSPAGDDDAMTGGSEQSVEGADEPEGAKAADTTGPEREDDPDAEDVEGELDEEDIELDLADPTEGKDVEPDEPADVDDEDDEDELSSGDHGVPDSL